MYLTLWMTAAKKKFMVREFDLSGSLPCCLTHLAKSYERAEGSNGSMTMPIKP